MRSSKADAPRRLVGYYWSVDPEIDPTHRKLNRRDLLSIPSLETVSNIGAFVERKQNGQT
jgi:hypothetical protein